jgi:tyrosyl-DNA phosphodiesterase 2
MRFMWTSSPQTAPGISSLINVHLDSLKDTLCYRAQQMEFLAIVLREPGCSGGIIEGDFIAISAKDDDLVDKNELSDIAREGRP